MLCDWARAPNSTVYICISTSELVFGKAQWRVKFENIIHVIRLNEAELGTKSSIDRFGRRVYYIDSEGVLSIDLSDLDDGDSIIDENVIRLCSPRSKKTICAHVKLRHLYVNRTNLSDKFRLGIFDVDHVLSPTIFGICLFCSTTSGMFAFMKFSRFEIDIL